MTDDTFRDSLATVTKEGKRVWINPRKPSGRYYTARTFVSILLLAFLFSAPFIKIDGHPFMIFNFLERKFIIFGIPFGPQDFHILVIATISLIVFIILFTVIYGRIFCGWVCPQTIFMEMVFRKIEYWIEGNAKKQAALRRAPWTADKIFKKTFKNGIFFIISFVIANFFLAYIIGMDRLITIVRDPPSEHIGGLVAITIFSGVFFFVFANFREQVCTMVCPYGRLQGVLLDQNSIVIAYDYLRGEPRGKIKKSEPSQNLGDCIDCHLCVEVCPTGIDIRNGTQLECINCTACIDACDDVMLKVKRPKGLIRYASKNEIETKARKIFSPRTIGYTVVLLLLIGLLAVLVLTRSNVELTILRTPGLLYQDQPGNKISNLYDVKIINKTFDSFPANLQLQNINGEIKLIGSDLIVEPQEVTEAKFLVILNKDQIKKISTPLEIAVVSNNKTIDVIKTSFLGRVTDIKGNK